MKIGYRIENLRKRRNVTLNELALKTGLTASFISQLERDLTSASIDSLEKIASALDTNVVYFFDGAEQEGLVFMKKPKIEKHVVKKGHIILEKLKDRH